MESPANLGSGNMVEISAAAYNTDGDEIESAVYPAGGGSAGRATMMYYNFRDQVVAEMNGAVETSATPSGGAAADTATNNDTFVSFYTLDNLGEATETDTYNAEADSVTFGTGSILGPGSGSPDMVLAAATTDSYDNQGRVYSSSIIPVSPTTHAKGSSSLVTNTYFDADGNVIAAFAPGGLATKSVYNGAGWETTTYTTDGGQLNNSGNITPGTSTAYAAAASAAEDVVLTQTQYFYDYDGNVIETITSDRFNNDASSAVNALGTPTSGVEARVSYAASYYDHASRDVADINAGTFDATAYTLPAVSSATSGTTTSLTDTSLSATSADVGEVLVILTGQGAGERATITGYSTNTVTFAALGTAPAAGSTYIIIDPVSLLTQTVYNAAGQVAQSIDPDGIITQTSYDMLGRTTQIVADYTNGTPTAGSNQTTKYSYDGMNHVVQMEAVMPTGTPDQYTVYDYGVTTGEGSSLDSNDLLYQVVYPTPTGADAGEATVVATDMQTYTDDTLGEEITFTDQNSNTHTYHYNTLGQETADIVTTLGDANGGVRALGYSFNTAGLPFQQTSYSNTTMTTIVNQVEDVYNDLGQIITQYQAESGAVNTSSTPKVQYGYTDAADGNNSRIVSETYPNGRVIDYEYTTTLDSAISRIDGIADAAGSGEGSLVAYSYLGLDTIVQQVDGNGDTLSYITQSGESDVLTGAGDQYSGLDRFGRVVDQNWFNGSGGTIDRLQYGYDADGNVLYENNLVSNTHSQLFSYDGLSRLTTFARGQLNTGDTGMSSTTESESWSLDALGNWNSETTDGTESGETIDSQNQITAKGGSDSYSYDYNGNLTQDDDTRDGTTADYSYDAWNRLVYINVENGDDPVGYTDISYAADSDDAMSESVVCTGSGAGTYTTDSYYDLAGRVIETDATVPGSGSGCSSGSSGPTTLVSQYVWGLGYVNDLLERDDQAGSDGTGVSYGIASGGTTRRLYALTDANYDVV